MILLLEDDERRIEHFVAGAATFAPDLPVHVWRTAPAMLADLGESLGHATLISLDHDLVPSGEGDPGCGYDVATTLAGLRPCCPVIVHTSNVDRGDVMSDALVRGGWRSARVDPFGAGWIAERWVPCARSLLGR